MDVKIFIDDLKKREQYMEAEEREGLYKDINNYYILEVKSNKLYNKALEILKEMEKNKQEKINLSNEIKNKIKLFDERFKQQNTNDKELQEKKVNEMAKKFLEELMILYGINQQ